MRLSDEEREEFLAKVFPVWHPEPKTVSKPIHTAEQFTAEARRQATWDDEFRLRHNGPEFYGEVY